MTKPLYTIQPGRTIARDGVSVLRVVRVGNDSDGYAMPPAEADMMAHRIVSALNASARKPATPSAKDMRDLLGRVLGFMEDSGDISDSDRHDLLEDVADTHKEFGGE